MICGRRTSRRIEKPSGFVDIHNLLAREERRPRPASVELNIFSRAHSSESDGEPPFCCNPDKSHSKKNQKMLTARPARSATIRSEMSAWSIMPTLAQRERTEVSVGEKAVLVLKARKR
jgi:hypothetical protein